MSKSGFRFIVLMIILSSCEEPVKVPAYVWRTEQSIRNFMTKTYDLAPDSVHITDPVLYTLYFDSTDVAWTLLDSMKSSSRRLADTTSRPKNAGILELDEVQEVYYHKMIQDMYQDYKSRFTVQTYYSVTPIISGDTSEYVILVDTSAYSICHMKKCGHCPYVITY